MSAVGVPRSPEARGPPASLLACLCPWGWWAGSTLQPVGLISGSGCPLLHREWVSGATTCPAGPTSFTSDPVVQPPGPPWAGWCRSLCACVWVCSWVARQLPDSSPIRGFLPLPQTLPFRGVLARPCASALTLGQYHGSPPGSTHLPCLAQDLPLPCPEICPLTRAPHCPLSHSPKPLRGGWGPAGPWLLAGHPHSIASSNAVSLMPPSLATEHLGWEGLALQGLLGRELTTCSCTPVPSCRGWVCWGGGAAVAGGLRLPGASVAPTGPWCVAAGGGAVCHPSPCEGSRGQQVRLTSILGCPTARPCRLNRAGAWLS